MPDITSPRPKINTDKYGRPLFNQIPCATALARNVQALTTSFGIRLNTLTTIIRVYAIAKDVYLRWGVNGESYAKSDNFDEVIPAGSVYDFAVPVMTTEDADNGSTFPWVFFIGREAGATIIVTEK